MVREALLGDLDRAVKLSKEVRDYMFGRIPENKYSQEARKFAEERL